MGAEFAFFLSLWISAFFVRFPTRFLNSFALAAACERRVHARTGAGALGVRSSACNVFPMRTRAR